MYTQRSFFLENNENRCDCSSSPLYLYIYYSACAGASSAFLERRRLYYSYHQTLVTRVSTRKQFSSLCVCRGSSLLL